MAHGQDGQGFDPGTRRILEELRDLRVEMRADRRADRQHYDEERRRSDDRFERLVRELHEDSARREAVAQKVFTDLHTVGLAIVKTLIGQTGILKQHGQILQRIDRKLGVRGNGRPGQGNGRDA